jgi:hypothetical protein
MTSEAGIFSRLVNGVKDAALSTANLAYENPYTTAALGALGAAGSGIGYYLYNRRGNSGTGESAYGDESYYEAPEEVEEPAAEEPYEMEGEEPYYAEEAYEEEAAPRTPSRRVSSAVKRTPSRTPSLRAPSSSSAYLTTSAYEPEPTVMPTKKKRTIKSKTTPRSAHGALMSELKSKLSSYGSPSKRNGGRKSPAKRSPGKKSSPGRTSPSRISPSKKSPTKRSPAKKGGRTPERSSFMMNRRS